MTPKQRFDSLISLMADGEGVQSGQMFGKPCFKVHGKTFAAFQQDNLVFKLAGPVRDLALQEEGATLWDPSGLGRPMQDWISIPGSTDFDEAAYANAAYEYVANVGS